ncbi:hypothetical protein MRX96_017948 [Rhipicephalus microplus]
MRTPTTAFVRIQNSVPRSYCLSYQEASAGGGSHLCHESCESCFGRVPPLALELARTVDDGRLDDRLTLGCPLAKLWRAALSEAYTYVYSYLQWRLTNSSSC